MKEKLPEMEGKCYVHKPRKPPVPHCLLSDGPYFDSQFRAHAEVAVKSDQQG